QAGEPGPPFYTLDAVIDLALERNPAIAGATSVMEQSHGQQVAAGAYPNPNIGGYSGRGLLQDTGRAGIGNDPSTIRSITEYNVTVGQPIEWPAKRAARQRAAEAGVAGAGAGLEEARLNLIADVKLAFYQLLLAQRQAETAEQNLAMTKEVLRVVKVRVAAGEATPFEAMKANVEVLKANQALTRSRSAVRVARVGVDTVTAGALGRTFVVKGDFESFRQGMDVNTLTTRAFERHPTLRRQWASVEQADHTVERERQARVPDVTVNAGYWREIGREAIGAGLSIPMPFWYQRQGEVATAMGTKHRAESEMLRTRNEIVRAVQQDFQDAQTAAEQIDLFEKELLKQAQETLRIAQFSFQQGASGLLDVVDAQRVYRQTQLDYAQARFELSVALTRLERATGGKL
ncbi:MAG: TolC family protein, partial [Nitrospirae bacterium]|nr:TolC family protein [Nitrospirota bacterium]